jgi:hypothetical protein
LHLWQPSSKRLRVVFIINNEKDYIKKHWIIRVTF